MKRIMVIEDDPKNLEIATRFLRATGFQVLAPANEAEVFQMVETEPPHVLLLDMHLNLWTPPSDGISILTKLKNIPHFQSVPVLVLSGDVFAPSKDAADGLGCLEYIEKPVDYVQLIIRIKTLIC